MPKLGSEKRPVIVRVQTRERAEEVTDICTAHDLRYIIGIEPDKPEDITDFDLALNPILPARAEEKPGRNEPCPCGSGKKYKKCCGANR